MRPSLSLKDDDYRLSFLYGNFTTLTRFTEADLERVVTERLGPLYVSIHATDPELRARLLRNRRGATSLRWLAALLDAGIEVHGQIVVCPGINDGAALDDTLLGVLDRFPRLATVGVVPLGVSAHSREPELRAHTPDEAARVLDTVERWQGRFLDALGRRLVYAADEYYLLADRPFPGAEAYDELPPARERHRHGDDVRARGRRRARRCTGAGHRHPIGLLRLGRRRARVGLPGAARRGRHATGGADDATGRVDDSNSQPQPIAILTGEYGARVLAPLVPRLERAAQVPVRTLPVANRFFGGNIAVTGLLTGSDVARVLAHEPAGQRYLLPDVVLSDGRFLDGTTPDDLPRSVEVVGTDGTSLVAALR